MSCLIYDDTTCMSDEAGRGRKLADEKHDRLAHRARVDTVAPQGEKPLRNLMIHPSEWPNMKPIDSNENRAIGSRFLPL